MSDEVPSSLGPAAGVAITSAVRLGVDHQLNRAARPVQPRLALRVRTSLLRARRLRRLAVAHPHANQYRAGITTAALFGVDATPVSPPIIAQSPRRRPPRGKKLDLRSQC